MLPGIGVGQLRGLRQIIEVIKPGFGLVTIRQEEFVGASREAARRRIGGGIDDWQAAEPTRTEPDEQQAPHERSSPDVGSD